MQIDWTTLLLEIVNFLVLVWLLSRFLYRPVLRVVEARRAAIQQELDEARATMHAAEAMRAGLEGERAAWEQERANAWDTLQKDMAEEKARQLAHLREELETEGERFKASEHNRLLEMQTAAEEQALRHGGQFAARLLESLAGADVERRLLRLFHEDLQSMDAGHRRGILNALEADPNSTLQVASAYPLDEEARQALKHALRQWLGRKAPVEFAQAPELIAGLEVRAGYWVLRANLRDELGYFINGPETDTER